MNFGTSGAEDVWSSIQHDSKASEWLCW